MLKFLIVALLVNFIPYYLQGAHSSEAEEKYNLKATLKTTNSPSSNFKALPGDVEEIVSSFCDAQSLLRLLLVNKHWENLLAKETLWEISAKKLLESPVLPSKDAYPSLKDFVKRCFSFDFYDLGSYEFNPHIHPIHISDDGSTVVIHNGPWSRFDAVILTLKEGKIISHILKDCRAEAVSSDGSVVVGALGVGHLNGRMVIGSSYEKAFLWSKNKGLEYIDVPAESGLATKVSPDGSIVKGRFGGLYSYRTHFHWTRETGLSLVDDACDRIHERWEHESYDRAITVSCIDSFPWGKEKREWATRKIMSPFGTVRDLDAFNQYHYYTPDVRIEDILRRHKVLPEGWTLKTAKRVSRNGVFITGIGEYKGQERIWLAAIPKSYGHPKVLVRPPSIFSRLASNITYLFNLPAKLVNWGASYFR